MLKLNAKELRTTNSAHDQKAKLKTNPVYIIVDNVLDTYNVGAIFRLADAVAATEIILCGETETPPNTRIKKASINTTEWVKWTYVQSASEAIKLLRAKVPEITIYAIEQDSKSRPFTDLTYKKPLAFIVGNESTGVASDALRLADHIVEIPLWGVNKSLNVMVSLGIVLYRALTLKI